MVIPPNSPGFTLVLVQKLLQASFLEKFRLPRLEWRLRLAKGGVGDISRSRLISPLREAEDREVRRPGC